MTMVPDLSGKFPYKFGDRTSLENHHEHKVINYEGTAVHEAAPDK